MLYSASGASHDAFEARWDDALSLPLDKKNRILATMQEFSADVRGLVDDLVDERVQVRKLDKPYGAFAQTLTPAIAKVLAAALAERSLSFHSFLCAGYFVFWKLVENDLKELSDFVNTEFKERLRQRFDSLLQELRTHGPRTLPLVTTLTTVSTTTQAQCDAVAEWFRLPSHIADERYQLSAAIEIARAATHNVHRAFVADVNTGGAPVGDLPLTTSALAVLMDCLFVIFENAWKHSGLGASLGPLELEATFDARRKLLSFLVRSGLSEERRSELINGRLHHLRSKYLGELPLELVSVEGGSGFPKLARLTRAVPRDECPAPFDFGVDGHQWFVRITVPLYERDGAFDAYD